VVSIRTLPRRSPNVAHRYFLSISAKNASDRRMKSASFSLMSSPRLSPRTDVVEGEEKAEWQLESNALLGMNRNHVAHADCTYI
jgi:hypothetical protein